jgi:hypothetical protein
MSKRMLSSQIHTRNNTNKWPSNLKNTLDASLSTRICYRRMRKRPRGPRSLQTTIPTRKKNKKTHTPRKSSHDARMEAPNLTFSTKPINPDLYIHPIKGFELTQHPTKQTHTTLHGPDGTTICTIENRRLDKPHDVYKNTETNPPFDEPLAKFIHRKNKQHHAKKLLRELLLCKAQNKLDTQPLVCRGWLIPNKLYDTLGDCFQVDCVLHCTIVAH